jgi:hypothetical protein
MLSGPVSVRAAGATIAWSAGFRLLMTSLCTERQVPGPVPAGILAAVLRPKGLVLLWPCLPGTPEALPVVRPPKEGQLTTDLTPSFAALGIHLPEGVVIDIPVVPYHSPNHGPTLALEFNRASFLYRQSRISAIGIQEP